MDGDLRHIGFQLGEVALGQLMPMFVWLDRDGYIRGTGPTIQKLIGSQPNAVRITDVFQFRRPREISTSLDLTRAPRLRMHLKASPHTSFKGVAVPLASDDGVLLNLSFGYAVRDAVRDHSLSDTDFAATDLAIELLYLAEAKAAVMGEVTKMAARLQGAKARAEEQALTDALTGLGNRRALERTLNTLSRSADGFALIHLDLDYFKAVNDTLGHAAGDHVLTEVASVLRASVRGADLVARVGGDEFIILLSGVSDLAPLERVGRQILERMRRPIFYEGQLCNIAVSMGASLRTKGPTEADKVELLLAEADRALYASKNAGRGRLTFADENETLIEIAVSQSKEDRRLS